MSKKKQYKCPWDDVSCPHIDSLMMTFEKECTECEHYDKSRIKPTGGFWIIEALKGLFKRK